MYSIAYHFLEQMVKQVQRCFLGVQLMRFSFYRRILCLRLLPLHRTPRSYLIVEYLFILISFSVCSVSIDWGATLATILCAGIRRPKIV